MVYILTFTRISNMNKNILISVLLSLFLCPSIAATDIFITEFENHSRETAYLMTNPTKYENHIEFGQTYALPPLGEIKALIPFGSVPYLTLTGDSADIITTALGRSGIWWSLSHPDETQKELSISVSSRKGIKRRGPGAFRERFKQLVPQETRIYLRLIIDEDGKVFFEKTTYDK